VGEDVDAARAGVDGVFDQFLDHARGTFDHLAGGDAVDDLFGELADGHKFPGFDSTAGQRFYAASGLNACVQNIFTELSQRYRSAAHAVRPWPRMSEMPP